jgi:hypothetical protein
VRQALAMKGRLQEVALALMHRAFAAEQAFPEKLLGDIPASALRKGTVVRDEHRVNVLGMAEEHCVFRPEPKGDHVSVLVLETAQKA